MTAQPFAVDCVAVTLRATVLVPVGTPPRPATWSVVTVPARSSPVPENEPSTVVPGSCAFALFGEAALIMPTVSSADVSNIRTNFRGVPPNSSPRGGNYRDSAVQNDGNQKKSVRRSKVRGNIGTTVSGFQP
jgi:hypothetical protein